MCWPMQCSQLIMCMGIRGGGGGGGQKVGSQCVLKLCLCEHAVHAPHLLEGLQGLY
jgi:hypothetical protein